MDGMVNTRELSINVVIRNKPKMLTGLNQKVRSTVWSLILLHHGHHSYRRTEGT